MSSSRSASGFRCSPFIDTPARIPASAAESAAERSESARASRPLPARGPDHRDDHRRRRQRVARSRSASANRVLVMEYARTRSSAGGLRVDFVEGRHQGRDRAEAMKMSSSTYEGLKIVDKVIEEPRAAPSRSRRSARIVLSGSHLVRDLLRMTPDELGRPTGTSAFRALGAFLA